MGFGGTLPFPNLICLYDVLIVCTKSQAEITCGIMAGCMPVLPKFYQHFLNSLQKRPSSLPHKVSSGQPSIVPTLSGFSSPRQRDDYDLEMQHLEKRVMLDEGNNNQIKGGVIEVYTEICVENARSSMSCSTGTTLKSATDHDDLDR